ncbi:MAG TPA: glycosyltransferase 87 family protein [Candidatus Limnocylindrales bacterium]|nr:glycosyltransferase 87 family protein [Candidatus Limnocylindrales bacterium]
MARVGALRSPGFARPVRLGLFAAAALGALLGIAMLAMHLSSDPLADVHAYYDAGARLNAGLPLYAQGATTNEAGFYRYPPLLAIAFRPLALLSFPLAAAIWEVLVLASLAALVVRLGARRFETWVALGLLALPTAWAVSIGQAQVPLTTLLALGTPASVALAAQLKLFPALVAVWWLGRGDRPALLRFVAWLVALTLVQLVLEPKATLDFVGSAWADQVGEVRNLSPYVLSPVLWAVLVVAGALVALRLAPGRWGWPAAVALSVLASPRLLVYMLMTLLAAARTPGDGPRSAAATAAAAAPVR